MGRIDALGASRVLPPDRRLRWSEYVEAGGGRALDAALRLGPDGVVEHLLAAGLRGRGGAGFPTGRKWAAVLAHEARAAPATVVVNGAEGEPGSFKDRAVLRRNPHAVLEGALVAATVVGASRVVVALKSSFHRERASVEAAISEQHRYSEPLGIGVDTFAGPDEYLFGEETALLEAIEGRPPFPRVTPPYRIGVDEVGASGSPEPAGVVMAGTGEAPPTLVNNVETLAHVPGILANGPEWFRRVGTDESPGTVVCTVSGATQRAGVGEVAMGTPLGEVIETIGGGARTGQEITAVMSGVANALVTRDDFDAPVSYEGLAGVGSGLGAAGFIAFDDETDFVAVAAAVSRFLGVESCGQCTPCKQDGVALWRLLERVQTGQGTRLDLLAIEDRLSTVADNARCSLAFQHQVVVRSLTAKRPGQFASHSRRAPDYLVAPIVDIDEGIVRLDESQRAKQPDWTRDPVDSGAAPAERLATASPDARRGAPSTDAGSSAPESR
jgi:NADH-quinone oxidoreductase subunit F